ncbi:constitutive coactivator of peroxisome proliferator-activated receptor gamma isoform X3 [Lagenorhynchus albirostris]|uniref:constitutive coactivator of peroxisome proliferator-activated receptor gamma isoform X3 n=1 Tax=Lagenorhynchus albirostris TaxID=27610 RepID=UPI0028E2FEC0|nr:constitutive coactivator of peroxisome proliferator-activated receptor gamma isoform X3 [Lagenorhynchus albirostris]
MGVRGLQGFVRSSCPHICMVVNFKELAEHHRSRHPGGTPTIVVDAMCCLRYWYTPDSWICGGQWREYFSSLREFVKTFTALGIKLVFFFDGMVEQSKRDEWVKRRLKNNREIAKIFHYIKSHREQPGRNMFFIPSGLAIFTQFALKALGQETLCSLQEADYEVASYGLQNNCLGILGEDTDYLIYDTCPYFSISELSLDSLDTIMLCREKLCQSLGLSLSDLPLLACLLGNDIIPEGMFESFRYKCLSSYTSVKENFDKKGNIILAVADHISKVLQLHQGEKKLEEMLPLGPNKALFYKGVASYLLPGQKSPWFFQKPKGVVTLDKQVLSMSSDPKSKQEVPVCTDPESKQEVPMCTDPESKQEVLLYTHPESKQEVPVYTDPESKQEVPMCTDPEPKQEFPLCTHPESRQEVLLCTHPESKRKLPVDTDPEFNLEAPLCTNPEIKQEDLVNMGPEVKPQITMVSDPEILKVARAHHVQAESYLVYNVMSSGEVECSNSLEDAMDQALPSQAFVYRPVRQRVYSLLLGDGEGGTSTCPTVKEWFVYSGNPLRQPDLVRPLQMSIPEQIVTGDEKWLLYNNVERKRSWGKQNEPPPTIPNASLQPKKVMLCVWWDWKEVLYYELLPENQTINSNRYCSQLNQLKAALDGKHPELVNRKCIIFHQDDARPRVSLMTRQKLLQLGWEVLIHPLYSPDIAPLDFHLFWSLQNSLNGKNFHSLEDCKRHLEQFFAQKDKNLGKMEL